MTARMLIVGAHGQLGHALGEHIAARGIDVIRLGRADLDVTDAAATRDVIAASGATHVFNGAAYNAVDLAEQEVDAAMRLNGVAPGLLASACREVGATLMHFSTDYVFGAGHTSPIDEARSPAPLSAYARSKRMGEVLALQNNPRTFVVRVCGLYSHRRANFVRTMLEYGLAGRRLTVVRDQRISPTWVEPLAEVCVALAQTQLHGVYHAVASGECSWYAYAAKLFELAGVEADLWPIDQASWGAAAPRPSYSVLDNAMLRALGLDTLEPWDVALERFWATHGEALLAEFR